MADFLGFAWKVFVIILIISALTGAILAGLAIVNALSSTVTTANGQMLAGYSGGNTPISLVKPLLASFGWNGSGGTFDTLAVWETLAVGIPAFAVGVITVRWLIRVAK